MEDSQSFVDLQGESVAGDQGKNHPMAELLAGSFGYRELHHGDILEGTVVHVAPSEILIDIGSKSEGVLSGRELERMSAEARSEIQVGEKVLAYVLNPKTKVATWCCPCHTPSSNATGGMLRRCSRQVTFSNAKCPVTTRAV